MDEKQAISLVRRHFADLGDQLVRIDALRDSGVFSDFLAQSGLVVIETLTTMRKNDLQTAPKLKGVADATIFALAGPSLG